MADLSDDQDDTGVGPTPVPSTPVPHTPQEPTPGVPTRPSLSPGLRAECAQVYALGFLDASAGCDVENDDTISVETASMLHTLATKCIETSEALIAELYRENPQTVYRTLYEAGVQTAKAIEQLGPAPINLN